MLLRIHAEKQLRRLAVLHQHPLGNDDRGGQGIAQRVRPPLSFGEQSRARLQRPRPVVGTQGLEHGRIAMRRNHGVCADFTECAHAAQQRRGDERHVPRDHKDGRTLRGAQGGLDARQGAEPGDGIRHHTQRWKPLRGARIVADDHLAVRGAAQRRENSVRDADVVHLGQALGQAVEAPSLAAREQHANAPATRLMHAQMRSPRCSAATSSSAVIVRSTSSEPSPRRGRSFRNRPQLLHIMRS